MITIFEKKFKSSPSLLPVYLLFFKACEAFTIKNDGILKSFLRDRRSLRAKGVHGSWAIHVCQKGELNQSDFLRPFFILKVNLHHKHFL